MLTGFKGSPVLSEEEVRRYNDRQINEYSVQFDENIKSHNTLPEGYIHNFGSPSSLLLEAGIPDLPIRLSKNRLDIKYQQKEHPFELEALSGLVRAVQNPIAVFKSDSEPGTYIIMTDIMHNGENFVVALHPNWKEKDGTVVNSIRSVYPKKNLQIVKWINKGLTLSVKNSSINKHQSNSDEVINTTISLYDWLINNKPSRQRTSSKQQYNSAEVRTMFNDATKVIENLESSKFFTENLSPRIDRGINTEDIKNINSMC